MAGRSHLVITMKRITKFWVVLLLGLGVPVTLLATVELLNPKLDSIDREETLDALMVFGLPPTALSGWLIWSANRKAQQEKQDRLRTAFFQLLQENQGHITPIRLAMATGLEGHTAKAYLDDRAKEFNALYNISEAGNLSYYFELGISPNLLNPEEEQ
jgi:hypothetical protein